MHMLLPPQEFPEHFKPRGRQILPPGLLLNLQLLNPSLFQAAGYILKTLIIFSQKKTGTQRRWHPIYWCTFPVL